MKIAHKVGLAAAIVLFLTTSLLSLAQVSQVRETLHSQVAASIAESSNALARQIENWLNAKLKLMDLMAQSIDSNYSPEETQRIVNTPMLKNEFILVFGALQSDGKPIKNTDEWKPAPEWDGRQRPWYATGKAGSQALLTEPYVDSTTGEILISAVTRITNAGEFLGVLGGDIRLKTVADAVNTLDFNGAGYAFLLTRNGNIISHPNTDLNGKNYSELFAGQSPTLSKDLQDISGADKDLLVLYPIAQPQRHGLVYRCGAGQEHCHGRSQCPELARSDWHRTGGNHQPDRTGRVDEQPAQTPRPPEQLPA